MKPHRITQAEIDHIINQPSCNNAMTDDNGGACALGKTPQLLGFAQGAVCIPVWSSIAILVQEAVMLSPLACTLAHINDQLSHKIAMHLWITDLSNRQYIQIIDSDLSLPEIKETTKELVSA